MSWFNKRKTTRDREAGLVFAWRVPHSSNGRMFIATVVIGLIVGAAATTVKVRVVPPPRVLERRASLQLADRSISATAFREVDERSPFPLRLDPARIPQAKQLVASALQESCPLPESFRPELKEWPQEKKPRNLPAAVTGVQVLPPLPDHRAAPPNVSAIRLAPHLTVSDQELSARVPAPLPPWNGEIDPKWAGKSFQVIAEVTDDGSIRTLMPVDPAVEPWQREAQIWLRKVRFEGPVQAGYYPLVLKFASRHD